MNLVIAGSRDFNDYDILLRECDLLIEQLQWDKKHLKIVSGTARGADKLGEYYAKNKRYELILMPAKWDLHGKKAGYMRNQEMAKIANQVILFWDQQSPGTKHMYDICMKLQLPVKVINYKTLYNNPGI